MQYFPKFKPEDSKLKSIVINDSVVILEEAQDYYDKLDDLEHLDLSFNQIETIPEKFRRIRSLRFLSLRRNLLKSLPNTLFELKMLEELDLSDNKFQKIPLCVFQMTTLVKLNFNLNMLDTWEFQGTNNSLKYLYLSHNLFKAIPIDLKNFIQLKHVALDNNKILEINHNFLTEITFKVKVSLANNQIKNKDTYTKIFKGDVLEVGEEQEDVKLNKNAKEKEEKKVETKTSTFMDFYKDKVNETPPENNFRKTIDAMIQNGGETPDTNKQQNSDIDRIMYDYQYKTPQHFLEKKIAEVLKSKLTKCVAKMNSTTDEKSIREHFKLKKQRALVKCLEEIINKKQEAEISKFNEIELKADLKSCYDILNKIRVAENTGNDPEANINDYAYFKKYYKKNEKKDTDKNVVKSENKQRGEDIGNLMFLKHLHNVLVSSKVKLYLQYISNLDKKLSDYIVNLIDENESNTLIFLLTELKLFMKELVEYFDKNVNEDFEVNMEYRIPQTSNVIYRIFKDNTTGKILYRLGLKEIKYKKYEIAEFEINHSINYKHKVLENYLGRLISVIKQAPAYLVTFD
jgi:hypothetical protein